MDFASYSRLSEMLGSLQVAVSSVLPQERILIRNVEEYPGIYHGIARYGYTDAIDHGAEFLASIINQVCSASPAPSDDKRTVLLAGSRVSGDIESPREGLPL